MENNKKTELIRKNGMEGKKQSVEAKNKISLKQKMRHAMYKSALKECALRKLELTHNQFKNTNMEDQWFEVRMKAFEDFLSLMEEVYDMREIEKALFDAEHTDSYLNMKNVEADGIDENYLNTAVSKALDESVNKFLKQDSDERN